MTDEIQVFISHARGDKEIAKRIYEDLKKEKDVQPWLNEKNIRAGQVTKELIKKAIKKSNYFLLLISNNWKSTKGYFHTECKIASELVDEQHHSRIFTLPALIDVPMPQDEWFSKFHPVDFRISYKNGLNDILRVIIPGKHPKLRSSPITVSKKEVKKAFKLDKDQRPLDYIPNDLKDNQNGTVSDNVTKLMWEKSGKSAFRKYLAESEEYGAESKEYGAESKEYGTESKEYGAESTEYEAESKEYGAESLITHQPDSMTHKDVRAYVEKKNNEGFAGFEDWRLPTVEELTSLYEPKKNSNGLYIDPLFIDQKMLCGSSDKLSEGGIWSFDFYKGKVCGDSEENCCYVRLVRNDE